MKHLFIAGALAVATSAAVAQPFDFQRQTGGPEHNFYEDTEHMVFAPVVAGTWTPSLNALMVSADVDGIAPNAFQGQIIESGPTRISLYEIVRDSPEGIAYRDYHERHPAGTDWDRVAREFRAGQDRDLAANDLQRDRDS